MHLSELIIIGGAALGALVIISPVKVIKDLIHSILASLKGAPYNRKSYEDLFCVLWLTAQDEKIKEAVERAFRHPFSSLSESSGLMPNKNAKPSSQESSGQFQDKSIVELTEMLKHIQEMLQESDEQNGRAFDIEETKDGGIKLSLFDRSRRPVFEPQSCDLTEYGDWVMSSLACTIAEREGSQKESIDIAIAGHTETGGEPQRENYTSWELSADRANVARRRLLYFGVNPDSISKVSGYSDTVPMPNSDPSDETNRRVTVLIHLIDTKVYSASAGISG
jgi:chemotaxis protein MotB